MDSWVQDGLRRDVHSKDTRHEHLKLIQEDHERNRAAPIPLAGWIGRFPDWGSVFFPGEMGAGKTLLAHWLLERIYRCGWPIFTTASTLYGQRLSMQQSFIFPDLVTPGSGVFIDEIHAVLDRYASNSIRNRSYGQARTALRKMQCLVIGASANSALVSMEFKGAADITVAGRLVPPQRRGMKLVFPEFCSMEVRGQADVYFSRDRSLEDSNLGRWMDAGRLSAPDWVWFPRSDDLYNVSKGMDSFETFKIGEAFGITKGALKDASEGAKTDADPDVNVLLAYIDAVIRQIAPNSRGSVNAGSLRVLMDTAGYPHYSQSRIQAALQVIGVSVSARGNFQHEEAVEKLDQPGVN